jgi:hypothetical protein
MLKLSEVLLLKTPVNAVVNHQQQAQAVSYRLFSLPLYLVERFGSIAAFPLQDADSQFQEADYGKE